MLSRLQSSFQLTRQDELSAVAVQDAKQLTFPNHVAARVIDPEAPQLQISNTQMSHSETAPEIGQRQFS